VPGDRLVELGLDVREGGVTVEVVAFLRVVGDVE